MQLYHHHFWLLLQAALLDISWASVARLQLAQSAFPAGPTVPPILHNVVNDSIPPSEIVHIPNTSNNTYTSPTNASNEMLIHCDVMMFGHGLDKRDCLEAIFSVPPAISPVHQELSFGERAAGRFDIGLPRRYLSNNGLCAIQPRLVQGATAARLTPNEARKAAVSVVDRCVDREVSTGGIAGYIGQY